MDMQTLKDIQDNGGIMLSIIGVGVVVGVGAIAVRTLDWRSWRKELKHVARVASSDVGQHEVNYHEAEILHNATVGRLLELQATLAEKIAEKKLSKWEGADRRGRA